MPQRQQIRLLPVNVANKIAAGEVVERPASIVKELIENSMDAGATRIEITVTAGGRKLISVADDGCGMDHDNALMCLEPQATSKIRDVDDIERISTYGFRGEAIPSIAAVSRMTLKTCAKGEVGGTCIEIAGGQIQNVTDIGFPSGTTFEVRDLFFNVPARRKFLKSYQTEQTHIRTAFLLQAISHPEIGLKLKADGRVLDNLLPGAKLAERITEIFGEEFMSSMREVDYEAGGIKVYGYVGIPSLNRADRGEQYLFVNRRAATAAVIPYALREAYSSQIEEGRKPVVILFVDVPPTDVDVNVHPTKREVRFRDASAVRDAVINAVTQALGITPPSRSQPQSFPPQTSSPQPQWPQPPLTGGTTHVVPGAQYQPPANGANPVVPVVDGSTNTALSGPASAPTAGAQSPSTIAAPTSQPPAHGNPFDGSGNTNTPNLPPVPGIPARSSDLFPNDHCPWSWCRMLGQIADGYILIETDGGYAVVDPQAAHERIVFERMLESMENAEPVSQPLLIPENVNLAPDDANRIKASLDILRSLGFGIDTFGHGGNFIVDALPQGIDSNDCRKLLADISSGIATSGIKRGAEKWREQTIAAAAARASIPQKADLHPDAMLRLVHDLAMTKTPYTSPRGRPTMLFTSLRELARKFNRE